MSELIPARLRRRARAAGADPLLTWYEPASGARTELSAVTLLNWVDKTSHLLDELDVTPGDVVALPLAADAPGHWVTAVWTLACWQVGAAVTPAVDDDVALVVTGPGAGAPRGNPAVGGGTQVVACSLHPLGLPLGAGLPAGALDYALEVRGQSDVYPAGGQPATGLAWRDGERYLDQAALVAEPWPAPRRRLVRPGTPWETVYAVAVEPLLTGGSAVVVSGPVPDELLARIAREERADRAPDAPRQPG